MSESSRGIHWRDLAFGGILVLALGLRLADLGSVPLSDAEAREALSSAAGTDAASAFWSESERPASSGLYLAATWLLFQATGSGEAAARFFPAILGALIVLPPWLLRRRLGDTGALMAAFLLAISPSLVAISRTAGGGSAAVVGLTLAAACLVLAMEGDLAPRRASILLGASLAIGLAGGSLFFLGVFGFVIAVLFAGWIGPRAWPTGRFGEVLRSVLPAAIAAGIGGAIVLSVLGGILPRGATSLGEGLRLWLMGWAGGGTLHPVGPSVLLLVYEPLVLVFGVVGLIGASRARDALGIGLGLWAAVALVLAIVYPGRTGEAVAWSVIPLAVLAGRALAREVEVLVGGRSPWAAVGVAALLLVLFLYAGLQLSAYAGGIGPGAAPLDPRLRLGVAIGALVVAALAAILIGFGWSFAIARSGAAGATAAVLLLMTVSAGTWLNFHRERLGAHELWASTAPTYGLNRLNATLHSLAMTSTGVRDELPLAIFAGDVPPSLVWAARDLDRFHTSDSGVAEDPPLILLPADSTLPDFLSEYVGQTIVTGEGWDFDGPLPPRGLTWWFRRTLPTTETTWILLVRSDLATLGEADLAPPDEP